MLEKLLYELQRSSTPLTRNPLNALCWLASATGERTKLENDEMELEHAYDMLMVDLKAQTGEATQDRDENVQTKARKLEAEAQAKADLDDTSSMRNASQK